MERIEMDDFLIVGGGIAGVSAAARLATLSRVTLVEAEAHLGYHASGRSAAIFLEHYGNETVRALNRASAAAHHADGILSARPFLMLADADSEETFIREVAAFGASEITRDEAAEMLPILNTKHVHRAARYDLAFDLDTDRLLQAETRKARAAGARIVTAAPVSRIVRETGRWKVDAGADTYTAAHIVNAAGAWADEIAKTAGVRPLGLKPYRRSMARLPAPGDHDTRGWPFALDVTEGGYAKPDAGAWLVSPAEADPVAAHDAWADDLVIAEALDRYSRFVTEAVTRVTTTWAGLRTFAPDSALVIGPDPTEPSFLWLAGQGGYGFQTAPAAADLLVSVVSQTKSTLPAQVVAALSPARF